ncbi:MAG TPA: VTT domain-containing protein [Pyrinomonadaceae bacterium]|nr:VTT domain-containing protein [Pyrinomonadaceae bacterium]
MSDHMLEWLAVYGMPVYFAILVIASAGVPFPITLMVAVAGAFVDAGEMEFWQVVVVGAAGAAIGDNIGYALGRFGGRRKIDWLAKRIGGWGKIERAEEFSRRWGATGIFLSRWLVTPLGPWINITSGLACYSWARFAFWDVLGELIWVTLYATLGWAFSNRVQAVASMADNLTWLIFGVVATVVVVMILVKMNGRQKSEF